MEKDEEHLIILKECESVPSIPAGLSCCIPGNEGTKPVLYQLVASANGHATVSSSETRIYMHITVHVLSVGVGLGGLIWKAPVPLFNTSLVVGFLSIPNVYLP